MVDADLIGHGVLDAEAFEDVAREWPEVVVDGRIDRRRLAGIVFADRQALQRLEEMTHPAIRARIGRIVEQTGSDLVVVEAPLARDFLGPGWVRVVVDAPGEVRRRRLVDRGMPAEQVEARMAAQPEREEWLQFADHVIDNSSGEEALAAAVDDLLTRLSAGAGTRRPPTR